MKRFYILIVVYILTTLNSLGQTEMPDYITISSRVLDGQYKREIKIDRISGEIYCKKKGAKKYKLLPKLKNDSIVLFFKDSITYNKIDNLLKMEAGFDEVGYMISFTHKECSGFYPCRTRTESIEFGIHTDNKELQRIIDLYCILRAKAKI